MALVTYDPAVHHLGCNMRPAGTPRPMHLADFIDRHAFLEGTPPARMWIEFPSQIGGAMGNNTVGDCTAAKFGHAVAVWTADATQGKAGVILPDSAIIAAYSAYSGYNPSNPASDVGATLEQSDLYFQKTGVNGHKLLAYPFFSVQDRPLTMQVINVFGVADIALQLPKTAQGQIGGIWTVVGDGTGDAAPGTWGGHNVATCGYDANFLYAITWGFIQKMTWQFCQAYCPDSMALVSRDWLQKSGKTPGGLNLQQLIAYAGKV